MIYNQQKIDAGVNKIFSLEAQRKYMRIPFKEHGRNFDGCDCGGLVWLIYKTELNIELPDWRSYYQNTQLESSDELSSTIKTMLGNISQEVLSDSPILPYDVISLKFAGMPIHVGIMVDAYTFIHIMKGYNCVRQERIDRMNWRRRIDGIFRDSRVHE